MNRWALQLYVAAGVLLRERTDRLAARRSAATGDRGQGTIEYLGIAVVIVVIIGVLAGTTDIGQKIKDGILNQIDKITGN
ncbi:MAG: hypothetical protein FWE15_28865 [Actinomycetia bacterium]|uniref:hypothetical protein n=1 Tax=Streptomyces sp. NPDC020917 TaxID=3365102 RepID=UPI0027ED620B|nr:hypothetical protein [Actinomycetes bacterium]